MMKVLADKIDTVSSQMNSVRDRIGMLENKKKVDDRMGEVFSSPIWVEGFTLSESHVGISVIHFEISEGTIVEFHKHNIKGGRLSIYMSTKNIVYNKETVVVWLDLRDKVIIISSNGIEIENMNHAMILWEINYSVIRGRIVDIEYTDHRGCSL